MSSIVWKNLAPSDFQSPSDPKVTYGDSFIQYDYGDDENGNYTRFEGDFEYGQNAQSVTGTVDFIQYMRWAPLELSELDHSGYILKDFSLTVSDFQNLTDSQINVKIFAGSDTIVGSRREDKLYGYGGDDVIKGGPGGGDLRYENNIIDGGAGADTLFGAAGKDTIYGGTGNDKLYGGVGADKLYGGSGADTFLFLSETHSTMEARDMIYDFSQSQGDKINLSVIDANSERAGNQAFLFIGEKAFSGKAQELRYIHTNGDTYIYGDLDGDKQTDFSIRLDKTIDLVKGDFLL